MKGWGKSTGAEGTAWRGREGLWQVRIERRTMCLGHSEHLEEWEVLEVRGGGAGNPLLRLLCNQSYTADHGPEGNDVCYSQYRPLVDPFPGSPSASTQGLGST